MAEIYRPFDREAQKRQFDATAQITHYIDEAFDLKKRVDETYAGIYGEAVPLQSARIKDRPFSTCYVRVGDQLLITSDLLGKIPDDVVDPVRENVTWLWKMGSMLTHVGHTFYTPPTMYMVRQLNLTGMHVLDMGAADGIQTIAALKAGARTITAIERERAHYDTFFNHAFLNNLHGADYRYVHRDLSSPHALAGVPTDEIEVVIANLGQQDNGVELQSLDLLEQMPNVRVFIGGGYMKNVEEYKADRVLDRLQQLGFNENYGEVSDKACHNFIVERRV